MYAQRTVEYPKRRRSKGSWLTLSPQHKLGRNSDEFVLSPASSKSAEYCNVKEKETIKQQAAAAMGASQSADHAAVQMGAETSPERGAGDSRESPDVFRRRNTKELKKIRTSFKNLLEPLQTTTTTTTTTTTASPEKGDNNNNSNVSNNNVVATEGLTPSKKSKKELNSTWHSLLQPLEQNTCGPAAAAAAADDCSLPQREKKKEAVGGGGPSMVMVSKKDLNSWQSLLQPLEEKKEKEKHEKEKEKKHSISAIPFTVFD